MSAASLGGIREEIARLDDLETTRRSGAEASREEAEILEGEANVASHEARRLRSDLAAMEASDEG